MTSQQRTVSNRRPVSAWAIASLVFGVLGILTGVKLLGVLSVAAIVTGHIALSRAKRGQGGRGLAITGLILGYLILAGVALYFFIWSAA